MKVGYLFIIILLPCCQLVAQADNIKTMKSGQQISDVFTINEIYRYPEFIKGRVAFKDGTLAAARLNYQRLFQEMLYIDLKGDTLAIANPETIKFIAVGDDTFYKVKKGYVELLANYNSIKLAEKQVLKVVETQQIGAYGQATTSTSITTYKDFYSPGGKLALNKNENTLFAQKTEYYLSDKYNNFLPATKKNVEDQYANNHKELKLFLDANSINFNRKEDLIKLVAYLQGL